MDSQTGHLTHQEVLQMNRHYVDVSFLVFFGVIIALNFGYLQIDTIVKAKLWIQKKLAEQKRAQLLLDRMNKR